MLKLSFRQSKAVDNLSVDGSRRQIYFRRVNVKYNETFRLLAAALKAAEQFGYSFAVQA